jgi:hypothetical protein
MSSATIKYEGLTLEVEFWYQPEEKTTLDYPGDCEYAIVENVFIDGVDCTSEYNGRQLTEIEEIILNNR